jgi:hypothetical protein
MVESGREGSEHSSGSFFTTEIFWSNFRKVVVGEGDVEETDQQP